MHYDSKSQDYLLIRQHDSWLSVDPVVGCPYDCQYCILKIDGLTNKKPQEVVNIEKTLDKLSKHKHFIPNVTKISYGNNTDAFYSGNIENTLEFIEKFRSRGYDNPIAISTKSPISHSQALQLHKIAGPNLLLFLSYSGLDNNVEKGIDHEGLKNNFSTLSAADINILHYWRPLLESNTTENKILEVLELVSKYSTASICIGLKSTPRLYNIFSDTEELSLPKEFQDKYVNYLEDRTASKILSLSALKYPNYPIYFRTSCAVSYALRQDDYTETFESKACLSSQCPTTQRNVCKSENEIPDKRAIDLLLAHLNLKLPYTITNNVVYFKDTLSQDDLIFLIHNLRCKISAPISKTTEWEGHIIENYQKINEKTLIR